MEIIVIIFTLLLLVFSILDVKIRSIPSVLLTATILMLSFFRFGNFQWALTFGLIGYLLWEFSEAEGIEFGIADIKVMIMLGFFINDVQAMLIMLGLFAVGQVIYIYLIKRFSRFEEIPFIPLFLALWIGGLIGGIFI